MDSAYIDQLKATIASQARIIASLQRELSRRCDFPTKPAAVIRDRPRQMGKRPHIFRVIDLTEAKS